MTDTDTLSELSRRYVRNAVAASGVDQATLTSLPVHFAFMTSETAEPSEEDWVDGDWEPSTTIARCLIGPGGTKALDPGDYWVWLRIDGSVEKPIEQTGRIRITPTTLTLTTDQIAYLRSEVGDAPDLQTLESAYVRLGSVVRVAAEIVSGKLALLEGQASSTSLSIPGVISESESYDATIRALTARQARLFAQIDQASPSPADVASVSQITRRDRVR